MTAHKAQTDMKTKTCIASDKTKKLTFGKFKSMSFVSGLELTLMWIMRYHHAAGEGQAKVTANTESTHGDENLPTD